MSARSRQRRAERRRQLEESFLSVPLGFKLLGGPIASANPSVFQMDIRQSPRFGDYFRIWPGSEDNEFEVVSADRELLQVVLRVKEPRRSYVQVVRKTPWLSPADVQARVRLTGGRILSETRQDWRLELWTPEEERRYLCGKDDLHLFVAQFREGETVAEARESLKPQVVREAEARWPGQVLRQGEWFFLPLSAEESARLQADLAVRPRALKSEHPVGVGGRPHVADAVVSVDHRIRTKRRELRRPEVYARGVVRHPDHHDLRLDGWWRVVRNRQIGGTTRDRLRLRWID